MDLRDKISIIHFQLLQTPKMDAQDQQKERKTVSRLWKTPTQNIEKPH